MARFYKITEDETNLTADEIEAGKQARVAFRGTRGKAKALGREWNGGKALRSGCGVEVEEVNVQGGKPGLLAYLNALVGAAADTEGAPTKGKAGRGGKVVAKPAGKAKKGAKAAPADSAADPEDAAPAPAPVGKGGRGKAAAAAPKTVAKPAKKKPGKK